MPPLLRLSRFACWANCLVWRASPASPAATTLRQQMVAFPCGRVQLAASGCPLLLGQGAASAALHPLGGDIHSFMTQKGAKTGQRRTPNRAILGAIRRAIGRFWSDSGENRAGWASSRGHLPLVAWSSEYNHFAASKKIAPAAWFGTILQGHRNRAREPCPYRYGCGSRALSFEHPLRLVACRLAGCKRCVSPLHFRG